MFVQDLDELLRRRRTGQSGRSPVEATRKTRGQTGCLEGIAALDEDRRGAVEAEALCLFVCLDLDVPDGRSGPHGVQRFPHPVSSYAPVRAPIEVLQLDVHPSNVPTIIGPTAGRRHPDGKVTHGETKHPALSRLTNVRLCRRRCAHVMRAMAVKRR